MKILLTILAATLFILLLNHTVWCQPNQQTAYFPDSWLGTFSGEMYILRANSASVDTVNVIFEFSETAKSNCWTYRMTYNNPKYGVLVKDYELIKPDSLPKNNYLLDEKDGILIEEILMGNSLYSSFSVSGYRLFSILRKEGDELFFEIITTKEAHSLSTRTKADNQADVYVVKSYLPFTNQYVRLKRH